MAKTLVDIDAGLLTQAQRILGTTTKKNTVNQALQEIVRRDAAGLFLAQARSGIFGTVTHPRSRPIYGAGKP